MHSHEEFGNRFFQIFLQGLECQADIVLFEENGCLFLQPLHGALTLIQPLLEPFREGLPVLSEDVFLRADCIHQVALVLVGLAYPEMSSRAPLRVVHIENHQCSRAISEEGLAEVFMEAEMIFGAVPKLNLEVVCFGLNAIHVDFILLSSLDYFVQLANESLDEAGLAAARIADDANLQLDHFFSRVHNMILNAIIKHPHQFASRQLSHRLPALGQYIYNSSQKKQEGQLVEIKSKMEIALGFKAKNKREQINFFESCFWVFRQKLQKNMKKKYLLKPPSCQVIQRQQATTIVNQSAFIEHKPRRSQQRDIKIDKNRLKTDWPTHEIDPLKGESLGKMKPMRTLKKSQSTAKQLRKGHYYLPSNKQNSKQFEHQNTNRFTFNQFRDGQIRETIAKPQLDITGTANRNSQNKHLPRQSFEKHKMDKYRFCSPKANTKLKELNHSLEMKPLHAFNRTAKENKQNLSEIKPDSNSNKIEQAELEIQDLIGAGTFGQVFSARVKSSGQMIALKRVQQDKKYKTRELEITKMLNNPFIIRILGTFTTEEGKYEYLNIAMEAYHQNFFELMRLFPVTGLDAKLYVYQMLRGLNYMHSLGVCHRDLKPQNMLVKGKRLVICDFGSAKVLSPGEQNISYICSRCYRAPELIFQSTNYSTQIDMWSLGCILLEMLNGRPLFIADSSLNHILEVIKILGTPSKEEVRAMNPSYELSEYDLPKIKGRSFRKMFPEADDLFLNLIEKLVCYSPSRRLTAAEALKHPFFDQLREERTFKTLSHIPDYSDFYHFQKGEISDACRQRLVPRWLKRK